MFLPPQITIILRRLNAITQPKVHNMTRSITRRPGRQRISQFARNVTRNQGAPIIFIARIIGNIRPTANRGHLTKTHQMFTVGHHTRRYQRTTITILSRMVSSPTTRTVLVQCFNFLRFNSNFINMFFIRFKGSLRMHNRSPRLNNKTGFRFTTFVSIRQLINTINLRPRPQAIQNRFRRNRTMTRLDNANQHRRAFTSRTSLPNGH